MARRKKEPPEAHRNAIANAAQELFSKEDADTVSMDDIAKAAGYSKATLYVYFSDKEEIIRYLAQKSMRTLFEFLKRAVRAKGTVKKRYDGICRAFARYESEYPYYFQLSLSKLPVQTAQGALPGEESIFGIGEEINNLLGGFLQEGIEAGEFRQDLPPLPTVFSFWGMLSGLILCAESKAAYIKKRMGISKEAFLKRGFDMLYQSVRAN